MSDLTNDESRICFVISPIGDKNAEIGSAQRKIYEESIQVWEEIILPASRQCGLEATRADQIATPGEIPEQVCTHLRDDDIVVADVTGGNPNVLYELGLRHSLDKVTLQIGEAGRLPFDIAMIRTIPFKRSEGGFIEGREKLKTAIQTALVSGADPVTATRVFQRIGQIERSIDVVQVAPESPPEEEPGFLDMLADAEDGMTELAEIVQHFTAHLTEIGSIAREKTASMQKADGRGGGARARLHVANQMAGDLQDSAQALESDIEQYRVSMEKLVPGVLYLLDLAAAEPELRDQMQGFTQVLLTIVRSTAENKVIMVDFQSSLAAAGGISRNLRKVTSHISRTVSRFVELSDPILDWDDRIKQLHGDET